MLTKLLSDLHLWGNDANFRYVDHGEYVCVLAGDISEGMHGVRWAVKNIPDHIKVLYVPGNHEYYGYDVPLLKHDFREHNKKGTHVQILDNAVVEIGDVQFIGSTYWTDFDLYGNQARAGMLWKQGLNDARWIKNEGNYLTPENFIKWNAAAKEFIREQLAIPTNKTRVLITHYCAENSVAARFKNDPLTPGFASRIPKDIHSKFDFHFHGHTHDSFNYDMEYGEHRTKVICNPRGYGFENSYGFNEELVLDI